MIDQSVYPDIEHGDEFEDDYDRADYVQRICAACDFGVPPDDDTVALFRGWRDVFDRFPLPGFAVVSRAARSLSLAVRASGTELLSGTVGNIGRARGPRRPVPRPRLAFIAAVALLATVAASAV